MNWLYDYLDALEVAAEAGDVESQVALIEYHCSNYSYAPKGNGDVEIWGADHWKAELLNLRKAVLARHPRAQMICGIYLMKGHPVFGRRPLKGAKVWLSGWLGSKSYRPKSLRERLLALAKADNREAIFPATGRAKLVYRNYNQNKTSTCGIRIHYDSPDVCQIVIEQLPKRSLLSVTNAAERIATQVLYRLLLAGIDLNPEKIQWFEAFPADPDALHPKGSLVGVSYEWTGNVFKKPKWIGTPKHPIAVDLTDIHNIEQD
jgi:hypothetical protein